MKINGDIDGFILAGGASSRMGRPKSEIVLGDRSLVERAVSTMSELADERVTIVGNDVSAGSDGTRIKVIADFASEPDEHGHERRAPIFGLNTALSVATTEWIAVLAVDLPFVRAELLARLASFRSEDIDAVVPVQADGRLQPLCAIYRRDGCLEAARAAIATGEFSLHKLLGGVRVRRVEQSELTDLPGAENFFFNVNTPADLEAAAKLAETNRVVL